MQKTYTTYDNNGNKRTVYMPEDNLSRLEQGGGMVDLIPFIALVGTIIAGFIIF